MTASVGLIAPPQPLAPNPNPVRTIGLAPAATMPAGVVTLPQAKSMPAAAQAMLAGMTLPQATSTPAPAKAFVPSPFLVARRVAELKQRRAQAQAEINEFNNIKQLNRINQSNRILGGTHEKTLERPGKARGDEALGRKACKWNLEKSPWD